MNDELETQLHRWFEDRDEHAVTRAYQILCGALRPPADVVRVLGRDAVDEIRQDVLVKLLDHRQEALRGKERPLAYARKTFENALLTSLRKWGPRPGRNADVRGHQENLAPPDSRALAETSLDAEKALDLTQGLTRQRRLAVLLITRPDAISEVDWREVVRSHPPPPPMRPERPLTRPEARDLLFPPQVGQPDDPERRRQNFDRTLSRALADLRSGLGEGDER